MKKNWMVGLSLLALLSACSIFEKREVDYKTGAVQAPALEVPPDLVVTAAEPRYTIPAADGTKMAKYSDFSRDKADAQSAVAATSAPAGATAAVPVSAAAPTPAPKLLEVGGVRFILLSEPFDRSWRKVGLALERARIATGDVDRSKGIYFLKPGVKDNKIIEQQVLVHEADGATDVTVKEGGDLHGQEAARTLEALFKNLEK